MLTSLRPLPKDPREHHHGDDAEHQQRDSEGPDGSPSPVPDRGNVQTEGAGRGEQRHHEHEDVTRLGAHLKRPHRARSGTRRTPTSLPRGLPRLNEPNPCAPKPTTRRTLELDSTRAPQTTGGRNSTPCSSWP